MMKFEVDAMDVNPNSLIPLLIKKIEEQEILLKSYKEQVLSMEQAVRNTFQMQEHRLDILEKAIRMGVKI